MKVLFVSNGNSKFGISLATNRTKKYFRGWRGFIFVAIVAGIGLNWQREDWCVCV